MAYCCQRLCVLEPRALGHPHSRKRTLPRSIRHWQESSRLSIPALKLTTVGTGAIASDIISLALTAKNERKSRRSMGASGKRYISVLRQASSHKCSTSGAMYCIATLWACCYPTARILLFFVIPCPAWGAITGVLAIDGYNAWLKSKGDFNAVCRFFFSIREGLN